MKWIGLVIAFGCFLAVLADSKYGDQEYLEKEKDLLLILKYIHQPFSNAELYAFGTAYKIEADYKNYNNVKKVKTFVDLYNRKRLLPRSALFSIYNQQHLFEAKALFEVFYSAKSYETLAQVVSWARFNTNEKLFMYVLALTVAQREDLKILILPPPYEVCPYQYVNGEVIKKAQRVAMQGFYGVEKVNGYKEVIIPMNYTGWYIHMNADQKVSYFTEDVTLNANYYNFNLDYPYWLEGEPYGLDKDRRGEFYLVFHQQFLARYYLERLSNDLGHIQDFNWRTPIKSGYNPSLMFVSGKQFPVRPNFYNLYTEGNHKFVQEAEDRERRIRDVVDQGFINFGGKTISLSKPEDVNTLGNLIQGNPDTVDMHHNYHDHIVPSFLENYSTAARDPLFYQFYKHLLENYWKFMSHIEPYTFDELNFEGVEVTKVQVDKIETFFENFDVDITNAIEIPPDSHLDTLKEVTEVKFKPDNFFVKARTVRLNHKPFNYKLYVKSDKAATASIRVYIGPKYDEFGSHIDFNENRKNFVLLDLYKQNLIAGENVITRNSEQYFFYDGDQTSYFELYQRVLAGKAGEKEWSGLLKGRCLNSRHLMIPKGKKGGMTYQFFFVVSPYIAPATPTFSTFDYKTSCGVGSGSRYFEDRRLNYPLDRVIDEKYFFVSNVHFEDVEIYFNAEENAIRYF